jgi:hypothetical protein
MLVQKDAHHIGAFFPHKPATPEVILRLVQSFNCLPGLKTVDVKQINLRLTGRFARKTPILKGTIFTTVNLVA